MGAGRMYGLYPLLFSYMGVAMETISYARREFLLLTSYI